MTKKSFKRVFSLGFVASLTALAVSNVNALTVREETPNDITDGSYVIGISKFTPDQVLTGVKVSKATINDMVYNNSKGYAGPSIYYYDFGSWFVLDEDNNYNQITDTKIIASLDSRDVFYVNNVEKAFDISYTVQVPEGKKVMFVAKESNKTVVYNDGTLTIPASVESVTAFLVDEDAETTTNGITLDTISKQRETADATDFEYVTSSNSTGTISADSVYSSTGNVSVNGSKVTISGTIAWSNGTGNMGYDADNSGKAGHRIGLVLTVPNGTTLNAETLQNIKISYTSSLDDEDKTRTEETWTNAMTDKDNQFWFTPVVKEGEVITLTVKWSDDITQTFVITVAGELEEMPAGTLSGENVYVYDEENKDYTTEVRLSATAESDNSKITFSGTSIDWPSSTAAGTTNEVTVLVTPDEYYSSQSDYSLNSVNYKATHQVYNSTSKEWDDVEITSSITKTVSTDGKIVLTIPFAEDTANEINRVVTVSLVWDDGYTQSFDVVLDDDTPFVYPDVVLVGTETQNGGSTKTSTPDTDNNDVATDTVTVKGSIDWNTKTGGNTVTVLLDTSKYTSEEAKNLSIRVDGTVLTEVNSDNETVNKEVTSTANGKYDFIATEQKEYTVEVLWNGEKVVKTMTVNVVAYLSEAEEGSIKYAEDVTGITGVYSKSSSKLTIYTDNAKIPYVYSLASNAVNTIISNDAYTNEPKVEVTLNGVTTEVEAKNITIDSTPTTVYPIKVQKGKTTTVTVTWDALNVQTFTVVADADAVFATKSNGYALYADEYSAPVSGTTTNTYTISNGETEWKNGGYKLKDTLYLTPGDDTLTEIGDGAYMTITGGAYENYRVEKETLKKMFTADTTNSNYYLSVPLYIATVNDTIKITICWGGEYVENYTITVQGATKTASESAYELKITNNNSSDTTVNDTIVASTDPASTVVYSEQISLNSTTGYHELTATFIDGSKNTVSSPEHISKITVSDAESMYNGKDTEYTTISPTTTLHFTNDIRKAVMTIEYDDGYVQTVTVDCSSAKLPTIILSSSLDKDENGDYVKEKYGTYDAYVYTTHVGESVNLYSSTSPLNSVVTVAYADDNLTLALDGESNVLSNVDDSGYIIKANAVGYTVLKLSLTGTDDIYVIVYVLPENEVTINNEAYTMSDADNDNKVTATVTAEVTGGYYNTYSVTVAYQKLEDGAYETINATNTVDAVNDNGTWTASISGLDADGKYKFTVVAYNSYYEKINKNEAFTDTAVLETNPTSYTVKLNNTYGDITLISNIVPGDDIKEQLPEVKRANSTDENGVEWKYTFAGWYNKDDVDDNGMAKDGTSPVISTSASTVTISKSLDLVAAWTGTEAEYSVDFEYADQTISASITSGKTITNPQSSSKWYIDNSENFDSEGNLTNDATEFKFDTVITGDIILKTTDNKTQDSSEDGNSSDGNNTQDNA